MGAGRAGARGRDEAVSATALAGCGRGRDGRGCGEWEKPHAGATDLSPKCLLVTEMGGSPVFLPCSSCTAITLSELTVPWHGQLTQGVSDLCSGPPEGRK